MQNKQEAQSQSSTNAENTNSDSKHSSNYLVNRKTVEQFQIVGNDEIGYFIALGSIRLTMGGETIEECERRITSRDWELMINLILSLADAARQMAEEIDNNGVQVKHVATIQLQDGDNAEEKIAQAIADYEQEQKERLHN